MIVIF